MVATRFVGIKRIPDTELTPGMEKPPVTAYKQEQEHMRRWPWREVGLKPYWEKPAVRNFRGGGGNEVLNTFAPPLYSIDFEAGIVRLDSPSGFLRRRS